MYVEKKARSVFMYPCLKWSCHIRARSQIVTISAYLLQRPYSLSAPVPRMFDTAVSSPAPIPLVTHWILLWENVNIILTRLSTHLSLRHSCATPSSGCLDGNKSRRGDFQHPVHLTANFERLLPPSRFFSPSVLQLALLPPHPLVHQLTLCMTSATSATSEYHPRHTVTHTVTVKSDLSAIRIRSRTLLMSILS